MQVWVWVFVGWVGVGPMIPMGYLCTTLAVDLDVWDQILYEQWLDTHS